MATTNANANDDPRRRRQDKDKGGEGEGQDGGGQGGTDEDHQLLPNNSVVAQNETTTTDNEQQQQQQQVQPQQPQAAGGWGIFKTILVRMFIIYMISSFFRRGSQPQQGQRPDGTANTVIPAANVFPNGTLLDMYVYVTETEKLVDFSESAIFWLEEELEYGDWTGGPTGDGVFEKSGQVEISEKVQNNGSLYIHIFFVRAGQSPNPNDKERFSKKETVYKTRQLNKFKKRHYHTLKNLLTGTTDVQPDLVRLQNETTVEVLSHWHPNLTINLIDDHTAWMPGSIPSPLDEYIEFLPGSVYYYPIVYFNDYWNLNQDYMPINSSVKTLNLTLTYAPLSLFRWQMYAAQGMRSRWYSFLGDDLMESSDDDQDSLKLAFLDTNPYLLAITIIVSIIHSVFEFLAFKNDIQFWRNRKSLEGLSVRSVFFNVFQSVVVLLYVMDNETNFVIKVSIFVGLGIEIWKIHKVLDIKLDRENKILGVLPRIKFQDKSTYTESHTKEYDLLAFKYLSWLLFPLLILYAIYSVLYLEHKGWYSWVLGMMYGFLLTFGFIMMTPQLFINYKLKSVAHLPWRMLTYKALNTFIDDLFAFVIRMPMLYRLGCFRDDIIFCIYLYQRWIYRVDPKRVNEFGTSGDMFDEPTAAENPSVANGVCAIEDKKKEAEDIPQAPPVKSKSKSAKKRD